MSMMYHVKVTAMGEVRDKDGNLISSEPVVIEKTVSEDELKALVEPTEEN